MRILLIEDDLVDQEMISRLVAKSFSDGSVMLAASLGEALDSVRRHPVDVILSDLRLPDSAGIETANRLLDHCPHSPLILLTGFEDRDISLAAISNGVQDYLIKGRLNADLLERSIRHAIQRHSLVCKNDQLVTSLRESEVALQEKTKRLERACKTAQQFVDNVSHEFRTPLTVITEYASLIADAVAGPVNEEQAKLLGVIDDRASDLNNMVDDMLDVSRLESGLLGATRKCVSIRDIIDHVMPAIRRKAIVRNVELNVHVDENLPDVFCDDEKLGRVIVNLAINAIKFSGDPGVVDIRAESGCHGEAVVAVSDNGIGIPPERQKEIFRRFSQIKTELQESTKGFGLGLNIAQELVDINLGKMSLSSIEGKGSTFSFTVPINHPKVVIQKFISWLNADCENPGTLSAFRVLLDGHHDRNASQDVQLFLANLIRQNDMVVPMPNGQWLLLISSPTRILDPFLERLESERKRFNRNRPRGPLPLFHLDLAGTWELDHDREEIIDTLSYLVERQEKRKRELAPV